jgi:hypothetical protein
MSNDHDKSSGDRSADAGKDEGKGYKSYLNYLKDNKNSKISAWIGKASDIYGEISKYAQTEESGGSGESMVAADSVIKQGALVKAVEIARLEWVKAKLESEDPVDLSVKYNARMARLNDEYHHQKLLSADVSVVGFMQDKDSKADRLLVSKEGQDEAGKVFAVEPSNGAVVDVFDVSTKNCLIALRRAGD